MLCAHGRVARQQRDEAAGRRWNWLRPLVQAARLGLALDRAGSTAPPATELLLASGLVIVVSSLVMVYLALMLTNERTESNLRAMHRKLRYLADIDMLTRVPNRRHFHELAGQALARRPRPPCALMMFDIDHFKRINDLLGHATGDEALRQVARCVRDSLRTQDVAGRLGGDEFAVLLPETGVRRRDDGGRAHRRAPGRPPGGAQPGAAEPELRRGAAAAPARRSTTRCAAPTRPCTRPSARAAAAPSTAFGDEVAAGVRREPLARPDRGSEPGTPAARGDRLGHARLPRPCPPQPPREDRRAPATATCSPSRAAWR